MSNPIALIGGEEFADGFEDVHASLLEIARTARARKNGHAVKAVFLPTCAADDGPETVAYWCDTARSRLEAVGAHVITLPIVDEVSANDPENARWIAEADWIYLGGGYPHVGMRILSGTRALQALYTARQRGALIAGASAGAMMLCSVSWVITPELDAAVTDILTQGKGLSDWDFPLPPLLDCIGIVPQSMCWPHANQFFSLKWLKNGLLPARHTLVAVEEQTALVNTGGNGWQVLGRGKVLLVNDRYQVQELYSGTRIKSLYPEG